MVTKIKIHPLFVVFGIVLIFLKNGEYFLFCVLFSILHEFGHITMAKSLGVRIDSITLMPYGACVNGNVDYLDSVDNIKLSLAGPFINISFALLLTALWWLYPASYGYTYYLSSINIAIFLVNLLPCYPLDGGRVLVCLLKKSKKAEKITRFLGIIFSCILFVLFVVSIFYEINISLLFISLFILVGAVKGIKEQKLKVFAGSYLNKLEEQNLVVKQVVVRANEKVYKLYKLLSSKYFVKFLVVNGEMKTLFEFDEMLLRDNFKKIDFQDCVINLKKYIY